MTTKTPENTTDTSAPVAADSTDSIESLLTEFGGVFGEDAQPATSAEAAPAKAVETAPPVPATPAPAGEAPTEKEEAPLLSPLLAAASAREREAKAEAERVLAEQTEKLASSESALLQELISNPKKFIADHPELKDVAGDLALHFYGLDLGDDAPDELKAELGVTEFERFKQKHERDLAAVRQEVIQRETAARNAAVIEQYEGFAGAIPSDSHPYLAAEATADATEVLRSMAIVGDHMFQEAGKYPTANEVATIIERQLSSTAERYASINRPPVVDPPKTVPVRQETTTTETLSTENSGSSGRATPVGEDEHFEAALELLKEMTTPLG